MQSWYMSAKLHTVTNDRGCIWILYGTRVILYIHEDGCLMVPGNVTAYADIPTPPP